MTAIPLIEIEGLRVIFHGDDGRTTHAVDRVDLSVANGAPKSPARSVSTVLTCLRCPTRPCAICAATGWR